MATQLDARKAKLKKADALKLTKQVDEIYAAKRQKVTHVRMKDKLDGDALAALLLGPTGNLRAPTLRKGKTLFVGFEEEMYKKLLG